MSKSEASRPLTFDCRRHSVHRFDTDAVTTTEASPVSEKGVGKGGGARCLSFFLVALARENDSSHFSFFSSLPPCNAIFRFHAFGISDIDSKLRIVFLWTPHKRGTKQTTISSLQNMLFKIRHSFSRYFVKNLPEINI